jgi:hypothetical protein
VFAVGSLAILGLIFNFRLEVFRPTTGTLEIPHHLWVASHVGIPGARPPPGQAPCEPAGAFGARRVVMAVLLTAFRAGRTGHWARTVGTTLLVARVPRLLDLGRLFPADR